MFSGFLFYVMSFCCCVSVAFSGLLCVEVGDVAFSKWLFFFGVFYVGVGRGFFLVGGGVCCIILILFCFLLLFRLVWFFLL